MKSFDCVFKLGRPQTIKNVKLDRFVCPQIAYIYIHFDLKIIIIFFLFVCFHSVITHIFFVSALFHGWPDLWAAFCLVWGSYKPVCMWFLSHECEPLTVNRTLWPVWKFVYLFISHACAHLWRQRIDRKSNKLQIGDFALPSILRSPILICTIANSIVQQYVRSVLRLKYFQIRSMFRLFDDRVKSALF